MRVLVIGAGVVGLSCAIRLREAGYDAHVLARDLPLETTSSVAAALWYPYRALPHGKVAEWARTTYEELARLDSREPAAGVRMRSGTELLRTAQGQPWWRDAVPQAAAFRELETFPLGFAGGWRVEVPVADTSVYLPWLLRRFASLEGTLTRFWMPALPEHGVIVNCAGLAAGRLAGDETVKPVRGQVIYLGQIGLSEWWLDQGSETELTYIVPREYDIVVGGTAEEDSFDLRLDVAAAERMLKRATRLVPALAHAPRLGQRVGLRPARPAVRLDSVRHRDGGIVHCYGHGGAGITLSWGCAAEVVAEVRQLVDA